MFDTNEPTWDQILAEIAGEGVIVIVDSTDEAVRGRLEISIRGNGKIVYNVKGVGEARFDKSHIRSICPKGIHITIHP